MSQYWDVVGAMPHVPVAGKRRGGVANSMKIPKWCWSNSLECVVEILMRGHFPDTVIVKLPDDTKREIDMNDLRVTQ
jgi:hypothetical protein